MANPTALGKRHARTAIRKGRGCKVETESIGGLTVHSTTICPRGTKEQAAKEETEPTEDEKDCQRVEIVMEVKVPSLLNAIGVASQAARPMNAMQTQLASDKEVGGDKPQRSCC